MDAELTHSLRLFEHVHGHLGWLVAALLVHPAIVLRDRKRRAHLAVILATAAATLCGAGGAWLYGPYRQYLRQPIFADAPSIGLLFERKEHLAFGAIVLAWAGALAYWAARRAGPDVREPLATIAFRSFVGSAVLALAVAVLGTIVAAYRSF